MVQILAEVPGFAAADLKVEVRGTRVVISGTKSTALPEAQRVRFHCLERGHGRFTREIHVLSPVNTHKGTAALRGRPADPRLPQDPGQAAGGSRTAILSRRSARKQPRMSKPPGEPQEEAIKIPDVLPVLPLKDTVVFPYIILPLSVGRDKSVLAVDRALSESRVIMLVAQRDAADDNPGEADLFEVGTAAVIMRMLKLPDGRIRILVQGLARARVQHISQMEPYLQAKIERIEEPRPAAPSLEIEALVRSVKESLDRAVTLGKGISAEVMVIAANLEDPGRLADLAASNLDLKLSEAQAVLETIDPIERLKKVSDLLAREIQVLNLQQEISSQARGEIDRSQREYFLRQQLKAIQQELGEGEELAEEIANYRTQADEKQLIDGGARGAGAADPPARAEPSRERRDADHPHLSRLADRAALGRRLRGRPRPPARAGRCSTRTTTTSRRSRSASSNTSPCAS